MTQHIEEATIGYVMRYGGMCRDCADMDGVCQSGMPCDTDQRRAVIRHTIAALTYGINNGFITSPFTDTAALAAAEERGRIEERERSASKTAGVGVETDPVLVGEIVEAGTAAAQLLYGRDVIFHEQLQRMPVGTKLYAAIKGGEQ